MLKTLAGAGVLAVTLLGTGVGVAQASTTVNPSPPTFLDTCGSANDTYIIPQSSGVSYYVDGVKMKANVYHINPASPTVTIFPVGNPGVDLTQMGSWSHTFNTGSSSSDTGCASASASAPVVSASGGSSTQTVKPSNGPTSAVKPSQLPYTGIDATGLVTTGVSVALVGGGLTAGAAALSRNKKKKHKH